MQLKQVCALRRAERVDATQRGLQMRNRFAMRAGDRRLVGGPRRPPDRGHEPLAVLGQE